MQSFAGKGNDFVNNTKFLGETKVCKETQRFSGKSKVLQANAKFLGDTNVL